MCEKRSKGSPSKNWGGPRRKGVWHEIRNKKHKDHQYIKRKKRF